MLPRLAGVFIPATLLSYFFWLAGGGVRSGFTHDDLMNLWRAWREAWPQLLLENVCFFCFPTSYRPLGQLFYKTVFDLFGLNPLPFRICIFAVLIANMYLAYLLARRLTGSTVVGYVAGLLHSFQAGFMPLYYDTGTCYDVFCFFFYVSALCYYIGARQRGNWLGPRQQIVFLLLFVCALNAKELAVTLPVMIAAYEFFYHRPQWRGFWALAGSARKQLAPVLWGVCCAALFVVFKVHGSGGLGRTEGYLPTIRLSSFLRNLHQMMDQVFLLRDATILNEQVLGALAVVLLAAAIWAKSPPIRFAVVFFLLGIGPVAFFAVPRGMYAAYIPLLGFTMLAAMGITRLAVLAWQRVHPVSFDAAPAPGGISMWCCAVFAGFAVVLALFYEASGAGPRAWNGGQSAQIHRVIHDIRAQVSKPRRGARFLFLKDPFDHVFNGDWATVFIVQLLYRDPSGDVDRLSTMATKPDATAIARYDYVFTAENGRAVLLKMSGGRKCGSVSEVVTGRQ